MRAFYYYQLQQRKNLANTLFKSGKLFQQYLVDAYASVEEDRLDYIRKKSKNFKIRNLSRYSRRYNKRRHRFRCYRKKNYSSIQSHWKS